MALTKVRDEIKPDEVEVVHHRTARRLSDKILIAFHEACDQGDHDVAAELLQIIEALLERPDNQADSRRRRGFELFIAGHERLWLLRHSERFDR